MDLHTTHLPMTVFAAALGVMPHIWNGNRSRAVNDPLMRVTIYLTNHKEGFREVWLGLLFSGAIALTWLLPSLVHLSKYSEWSETHDPAVAKTCLIEWEQTVCCCMARRPTQIFGLKESTRSTSPEGFRKALGGFDQPLTAVLEASYSWGPTFGWDDLCAEVVLAHPGKVRVIAESRIKTDKIDSEILAHLLRANLIPAAHAPSKELRAGMLAVFAEFERDILREPHGRPMTAGVPEMKQLRKDGLSKREIAKRLGISRTSVIRWLGSPKCS